VDGQRTLFADAGSLNDVADKAPATFRWLCLLSIHSDETCR